MMKNRVTNLTKKAACALLSASMVFGALPAQTLAAPEAVGAGAVSVEQEAVQASVNDRAAITQFVTRLYRNFLLREPEAGGLNDWVNVLVNGTATGAKVVAGFVHSQEFQNQPLTDLGYVTAFYYVILGREPEEDGVNAWLSVLENGYTKDKVLEGFLNSKEMDDLCRSMGVVTGSYKSKENRDRYHGVTEFVMRLYEYCLGRRYDEGGLTNWVNALVAHSINGYSAVMGFVESDEMINKDITVEDFVTICYRTLLDREPDESGLRSWSDLIYSGEYIPGQVALGFCKSTEFNNLCNKYGISVFGNNLDRELLDWLGGDINDFHHRLGWMTSYSLNGEEGYTDYRLLAASQSALRDRIEYMVILSSCDHTIAGINYNMPYEAAFNKLNDQYEYILHEEDEEGTLDYFLVDENRFVMIRDVGNKVKMVIAVLITEDTMLG